VPGDPRRSIREVDRHRTDSVERQLPVGEGGSLGGLNEQQGTFLSWSVCALASAASPTRVISTPMRTEIAKNPRRAERGRLRAMDWMVASHHAGTRVAALRFRQERI
jgi:hypothetical protein